MSKFKVGDRVRVGLCRGGTSHSDIPMGAEVSIKRIHSDGCHLVTFNGGDVYCDESRMTLAPSEPRPLWAVLREAADVFDRHVSRIVDLDDPDGPFDASRSAIRLRKLADRLEAASRPKPPTLSEAVDAFLAGGDLKALREAREREVGK